MYVELSVNFPKYQTKLNLSFEFTCLLKSYTYVSTYYECNHTQARLAYFEWILHLSSMNECKFYGEENTPFIYQKESYKTWILLKNRFQMISYLWWIFSLIVLLIGVQNSGVALIIGLRIHRTLYEKLMLFVQ